MEKLREESRARYLQRRAEKKKEEERGKLNDKKLLAERGLLSSREKYELELQEKTLEIAEKKGKNDDSIGVNLFETTETGDTIEDRMKSAGSLYAKQEQAHALLKGEQSW